jgi:hypothetical protein
MPLRDHFRPPVESKHSWDERHGGWPAAIVQQLFPILPERYIAAPGVHLGTAFEIDVPAYVEDNPAHWEEVSTADSDVTVPTWAPPKPTLTLETEWPDQDEYEVRVYDAHHGRRLVAAVELISPANKDRPENRRAFVTKVAALLHQDVCVSLVDVVTVRHFSLYADLLELLGGTDPTVNGEPSPLYAVTVRGRKRVRRSLMLDTWFYPLQLGQPLPTLPIWLDVDSGLLLDLEKSHEETCRVLRIA